MLKMFKDSYKRVSLLAICTLSILVVWILKEQSLYASESLAATKEAPATANTIQTYTYMETVNLPCEYIDDETLYVGEQVVTCEEQAGICETTVMVTYENGEETGREIIDREIVSEPVSKEIHVGIKEKPLYLLPVTDYVFTSGYGARWGSTHYGIDLAVPTGTEVLAAADGEVIQSGWNGGYGISVYIRHEDGSVTRYGHMNETCVIVGEYVSQGAVIGFSGNTGDSTGPHVHFEIRIDDAAVNPETYFDEL
jgi:murein DD-endopeptidase MepM/ murein hydrolase activator NlpD